MKLILLLTLFSFLACTPKEEVRRLLEYNKLYITKDNFAVFGESEKGIIIIPNVLPKSKSHPECLIEQLGPYSYDITIPKTPKAINISHSCIVIYNTDGSSTSYIEMSDYDIFWSKLQKNSNLKHRDIIKIAKSILDKRFK